MTIKIKDILKRLFFTNRQSEDKYKGEIRQVSIKDIHEAKKSLEEVGGINYVGTNKINKTESRSVTEEKYRYDIIASLYDGIDYYKDKDEEKKHCIEIFARSKMTIEEIKTHLDQVRDFTNTNRSVQQQGTKLPQKSIPDHIR